MEAQPGPEQQGGWRELYRLHILILERYLQESATGRLSGEQTVYLAGMLARQTDPLYRKQIEDLIFESPEDMDRTIRRHDPYIGQNAPIVILARTNAEFLTIDIISRQENSHTVRTFELQIPARYFGIASFYAHQAGNRTLSDIFDSIRKQYELIVRILSGYCRYIEQNSHQLSETVPDRLWQRFGEVINERNNRKENRERQGIDPSRKNHISRREFNGMLNYSSPN
ncbi:MAG: hypothetical protein KDK30_10140 [Leptospiraceae bacterium]|nr:hypothetical protein [Leptospiraceae bacterium]